jgi:23S rRNA (cytosine1962-C5)-methyltransferase
MSNPKGGMDLLVSNDWRDYALLDSGDGRKLERFGKVTVDRPDAQALWPTQKPRDGWKVDAIFASGAAEDDEKGRWEFPGAPPPDQWRMEWESLRLNSRCAAFRHMGVFPEHSVHWRWAADRIRTAKRPVSVLNVFGYTGMMSLAAAEAGADVVHVDASPKSIGQGRENQTLSGLGDKPIRWICDDAMKFLEREVRRGRTYDALVLDPPKYGRGPKNEVWKFEDDFPRLLDLVRQLTSDTPLFVILTVYAVRLSCLSVAQALSSAYEGSGQLTYGEMGIQEQGRGFVLPTGLFARMTW